jgi:hypothetical protein
MSSRNQTWALLSVLAAVGGYGLYELWRAKIRSQHMSEQEYALQLEMLIRDYSKGAPSKVRELNTGN